jgi:hypothetical protein
MNNKEKFKKAFSSINVSKELENNILDSTVNKKVERVKKFRFAHVCSLFLILLGLTFTTVYAKEIKDFIVSWSSSIFLEDGSEVKISENNTFKEIPNNIKKTEKYDSMINTTINELEEILGFKILKLDQSISNEVYYITGLNKDGSIGRIDITMPNFIVYGEDKNINMHASFLDKNADEGYVLAFKEGLDASGGKNIDNSYYIENLNVNVVIWC